MWPTFVIVLSPLVDNHPGMLQGVEPEFIQAFFHELAIEAFDESILGGLVGLYQLQLHTMLIGH